MTTDAHEQNRRSWNQATRAHNSHKGDQAAFLRSGGSTLFPEERELLGGLDGRRLVHLQCNAGQDSLSLAALGAHVTGVDISDEAIDFARFLSGESGIAAEFERADVYDWLEAAAGAGRRFDVVYSSYGTINWLSDLDAWARGIAAILEPGGRLVLIEFHPLLGALNDAGDGFDERYPYFGGRAIDWQEGVDDYVGRSGKALVPWGYEVGETGFANPEPCVEFQWSLADVAGAILGAELRIDDLREYPYSNGCRFFETMVEEPGRRFRTPEALPLMFSVVASSSA